jgi:DNA-binding NarL/FixJ family response regulator
MKKLQKIRILLADDHKLVRDGLMVLINRQSDMEVVGEAGDGNEAVAKALELKPDLVLMDLSMPSMNGLRATEVLHLKCPAVKVLVLTTHEDPGYMRQLCGAHAAGFILKRSASEEVIRAIRKVAAGEIHFDATLAGKALTAQAAISSGKGASHTTELSERETEVVRGVAWGYSNKELADQLRLSVKTVETYRVRVGEKLGLRSRTHIVQFALRQGWLSEVHPFAQLSQ